MSLSIYGSGKKKAGVIEMCMSVGKGFVKILKVFHLPDFYVHAMRRLFVFTKSVGWLY